MKPDMFIDMARSDRRTIHTTCLQLASRYGPDRIMPEFVVIVEVLIPERQNKDPLADERRNTVFDRLGSTAVPEASRQTIHQRKGSIGRAEQQGPGVRSDPTAVKIGDHGVAFDRCKSKQTRATLYWFRGDLLILSSRSRKQLSQI